MNLFISIIIPVYNTPSDKITRCIDSVLNQTFDNYEIIIVDDGSEQECALLLDKLEAAHKCIRVIHKNNEGAAVARNVGILNANGQYIIFVDSDDFITKYVLQEAKSLIDRFNPDMMLGLVKKFEEMDFTAQFYKPQCNPQVIKIDKKQSDLFINHMLGYSSQMFLFPNGYIADGPWARICRTELVKKNLFTPESIWNEDTIWNLILAKDCKTIIITENIWYAYLTNSISSTRKFRENCFEEFEYRIKQELELVSDIWPHCLNGIYIRIWRDTDILCRTYLFHPQNHQTNKEKYKIFKKAIHLDAYIEMLKNIDFSYESNTMKKLLKELLRYILLYGPHFLAFYIWKIFTKSTYKQ